MCSLILNHNHELETDGVGAELERHAQLLPAPKVGYTRAPVHQRLCCSERITLLKYVIPDGGCLDSRAGSAPSVLSPSPSALQKWLYGDVERL